MNKQKTNQKGITLIALVITIIVLLILAGVSISLIVGENGVLNKAKNASLNTRGASVQEAKELWENDKKVAEYDEDTSSVVETQAELLERLVKEGSITADEKLTIETTGQVTIGDRTIVFNNQMTEPKSDKVVFCLVFEFYDIDKLTRGGNTAFVLDEYIGETMTNTRTESLECNLIDIKNSAVDGRNTRQIQIEYDKDNCPEKILCMIPYWGHDRVEFDSETSFDSNTYTATFTLDSNEDVITSTVKYYY